MSKATPYAWSENLIRNALAFILARSLNTLGCFPAIYASIMVAG